MTHQTIDLYFKLNAALRLAEHAAAATTHEGYGGLPPVPALVWAKSGGTFLMSNGRPHPQEIPDLFAHGWGPERDHLLTDTPVGGSDFGHMIPLTDTVTLEDGREPTFLEWLRESKDGGARWFVLSVDREGFDMGVDSEDPAA